jgi:hypothetical protein
MSSNEREEYANNCCFLYLSSEGKKGILEIIYQQYFADNPTYPESYFQRGFRMPSRLVKVTLLLNAIS